jgi:hypothetical protein
MAVAAAARLVKGGDGVPTGVALVLGVCCGRIEVEQECRTHGLSDSRIYSCCRAVVVGRHGRKANKSITSSQLHAVGLLLPLRSCQFLLFIVIKIVQGGQKKDFKTISSIALKKISSP